ncbi:sensitivity to high expression protein she9 [Ceratocystis pirilliformis]|uniref:Sensitive to high expression protein 9, mitochondrial n=1 Tax=Ceratocystis pirilliformis TaxID=259994 RepID=A0ABR3ZJ72_9PEZI
MHALLRPGIRLSLGAVRAANGSSGMQPSCIASLATRARLARSGVGMRLYSSQKPPSDSDFDIEKSPFAHLLKKPATSLASSETPATPATTTTDAATADNSDPQTTASSQPQHPSSPTPSSSSTASSSDDSTSLPFNKDQIHRNLKDTRQVLSERFSVFMDNVQSRVVHASETLNVLTGYTPIETIKMANAQLETSLAEAQSQVRACRIQYKTMNARRAATQREVTTLLARKDAWSPTDLERFTQLYRTDHEMESQVSQASESLTEAEAEEQSLSTRLNQGILRRYHEEQIWSDRIRRASTWGTWGLMGVNILLFLGLQFIAEPWKRNRLVKGVVAEEKAVLEEVRDRLDHVMKTMEENLATAHALAYPPTPAPATEAVPEAASERATLAQEPSGDDAVLADEPSENQRPLSPSYTTSGPIQLYFPMPANVDWSWEEFLRSPKLWRNLAEDFYSDRRVDMRMRDSATLVLEGMAVGTVITAAVTALAMGAGTGFPWNLLAVFT